MYLDLYDNITINRKLLKLIGMPAALYWAEMQEVLKAVKRKKKFDSAGFFMIDREYMEERTTLTVKEQYQCDEQLKQIAILVSDSDNPDRLAIDYKRMIAIISDDDPDTLKNVAKTAKPTRTGKKAASEEDKAKKLAGKIAMFKSKIVEPNAEIRSALERWVEMTLESPYSYKMTNQTIISTQSALQRYSTDTQTIVAVLEIAILKGWSDITWAINEHRRSAVANAAKSGSTTITPRGESTKVGTITF